MELDFEYQCKQGDAGASGAVLNVVAHFNGQHYPAKLYPIDDAHPAEGPELELTIKLDGVPFLPGKRDYDDITEMAWDEWWGVTGL